MESTLLGRVTTFSGMKSTFSGYNLKKSAFLVIRSPVGVLSVFSRSSVGGIRQGIREVKETAILKKRTFYISEFFGSSLVLISPIGLERLFRLWFVLGLLHGVDIQGTREQNLNKSAFKQNT